MVVYKKAREVGAYFGALVLVQLVTVVYSMGPRMEKRWS